MVMAEAPWSDPVDPDGVRRACAAILVENLPVLLAEAKRLLGTRVTVLPSARDRAAWKTAGGALDPAGPLPADPFAHVGPWNLVPNWPRPLVWDAVNLLADAYYRTFAFDAIETLSEEVRRRRLVPDHEVGPQLVLACVRARQHRLDESQAIVDDVLARHGDLPLSRRATAAHVQGYVMTLRGRGREARDLQREAVSLRRLAGDGWGEAWNLSILGQCEMHSFNLVEASRILERSRRQLEQYGYRSAAWQAAFNLAIARYKQGRPGRALRLVDAIEEPQRRAGQLQGWLLTRLVRAKALMVRGDGEAAAPIAAAVLPEADTYGWARERILALEVMGDAALAAGRRDDAVALFRESRALAAERAPRGDLVVGLDRRLAQERLQAGRPGEAVAALLSARDRGVETGEIFEEIVSGRLLATALRQCGRLDEAWPAAQQAIARARFHGAQLELARVLFEGARIQAALAATLETAWSLASEARDLLVSLAEFPAEHARCEDFLDGLRDRWRAALVWSSPSSPCSSVAPPAAVADDDFVACSPAMVRVAQLLALASTTDDPVLITGETGTGKEVAASRVHTLSRRAAGPFVAVNCAAVPAPVFEREFFGHARGAYTGADHDAAGLVERADGGTLLLDEVGELPPELQVKLLRLLQEGTYRRLGEPRERRASLRVIAATNADLLAMVTDGRFRQDLYFRLQVLEIHLPPLRDRGADIPALAHHAARRVLGKAADAASILGPALWSALPQYTWPGNVRELTGLVRRACLYHRVGRPFTEELYPRGLRELVVAAGATTPPPPAHQLALADLMAHTERAAIHHALRAANGSRTQAAQLLGISRKSLYEKLKRLDPTPHGGASRAASPRPVVKN
jgi:DNA-binding NtrC family response regulator